MRRLLAAATAVLVAVTAFGAHAQPGTITTVAGGGPDDVPALDAPLNTPTGLAVDALAGVVYVAAMSSFRVFAVDGAGQLRVVAGDGTFGFKGDGGPARDASLASPYALALDGAGNLFIADRVNHRVRRVDALTGVITTLAGTGVAGFSGDGGLATAARLNDPRGVALDAAGHLFVLDGVNHRVRRVDAVTGIITTVAGTGVAGFNGDGIAATAAQLNFPFGLTIDGAGRLLVADTNNARVRRVVVGGIISTVAGSGVHGFGGDGGPATSALLWGPAGLAVDPAGNLFIADPGPNNRVRRVDAATGIITTVAGTGAFAFGGDGGPATAASLAGPNGVAVGAAGDFYIADTFNQRVRVVDGATGIITTMAGNGTQHFGGDGGPATRASLNALGVAADGAGDLLIADAGNNRVRRVDAATGLITTAAGTGVASFSGDGGPATAASLANPFGVAVDGAGNVFVADFGNVRIRRIDAGGTITTVAGTGVAGFGGDGGPATGASLFLPNDVAADPAGNVFIADTLNQRVRRVDAATGIITTVAGNGTSGFSGDGGPATAARLANPVRVALDAAGNLFIDDRLNNRIRRVDAATGLITTVAGNGTALSTGDGGPATSAGLADPFGVAVDWAGNLFIAEFQGHRVRRVDGATGIITTVAGTGVAGLSGDGGPATGAELGSPFGLAVDAVGNLFIVDRLSLRIRRVAAPRPDTTTTLASSANPSVAGQEVTLTATVAIVGPVGGTPTGSVEFFDGATSLGTAPLAGLSASLTISSLTVGAHSLTARYLGDAQFNASTSAALGQTVTRADTTTSLASSVNPAVAGQAVTLTATVAVTPPGSGTSAGSVEFFDGATSLGTVPLAGLSASLTTSGLTVGAHSLTARYLGDAQFNASTSAALGQTVTRAETTTALTSSANPSVRGQAVTLTATVAVVAPGSGTPAGSVEFFDGATSLGTVPLVGLSASLATSALTVGAHSLTARYLGDAQFNPSTSAALRQTVNRADTTTTLTSSANPSVKGQAVTLTATVAVTPPGSGTPAGSMEFFDGATSLGTVPLAGLSASLTTSALTVGAHSLTARYLGDAQFNPSTSAALGQTVTRAETTTALASSANPSVAGQAVTLTATVAVVGPGSGTPAGSVEVFDGVTSLGTVPLVGLSASLTTSALTVGAHSLTARYLGDAQFNTSTSALLSQTVNRADTTTSLASSANPSVAGQAVTLTATVAVPAPGSGTPTGSVEFFDGATSLGTVPLAGLSASLTTSDLAVGAHSVTARYLGDAQFNTSTSAALGQTVNRADTTTTLASSANPAVAGQAVTLTATVAVVPPGGGTPTGSAEFFDGVTSLGTVPLAGLSASLTTSDLGVGAHSLTARYLGDAQFNASTSAALSQTVTRADTTTSLASSSNPSVAGQAVTLTATVAVVPPRGGTPTGTVEFFDGAISLGAAPLVGLSASLTTSALAVGAHSLAARYLGDAQFNASTSAALSQTVTRADTTTTLASSANPSVAGQAVTLTATVAVVAPGSGTPAGSVEFFDGATSLGTVPLAGLSASLTTSALAVGAHSLTARYLGDAQLNPSTSAALSQTVNRADTTTTLASSANPAVAGQAVTLTATVAVVAPGGGTPTGSVEFLDGAAPLGTVALTGLSASLTTSALAVGSHSLTARYLGDAQFNASTSAALSQAVTFAYTFIGLFEPYAPPSERAFRIRSAIPLQWQYGDSAGNAVDSAAAAPSVSISGPYPCGGSDADAPVVALQDTGGSGLRYDALTRTWHVNWTTAGRAPGCYTIRIGSGQTGQVDGPFPIQLR